MFAYSSNVKTGDRGRGRSLPPEALALVAARFRVLSDPVRLRILQVLAGGERNVNRLAEEAGATQPNVSKHLRMLREAGLVQRRQEGNVVYCALADQSVIELCEAVCHSLRVRLQAQAGLLRASPPRRSPRRSLPSSRTR